tara:strand:- start:468 stop:1388 length:921 start_codon:yes stop_codon:yes gene_type:complete
MRNFFAKKIYEHIKKNKKIILLSADIGNRLFDKIKKDFPNNFLNCGIAESNMITFASGLAAKGYLPFCYTITNFLIYKSIEQIRNDAIYNNNKIILVGTGSGLSYNHLGPTHHSLEDIGLINGLPNINIYSPADNNNLKSHLNFAITNKNKFSSYIRLGKKDEPDVSKNKIKIQHVEKISSVKGAKIALVSTGPLVEILKEASIEMSKLLKADVVNFHHLKPINLKKLNHDFKKYKKVYCIEEHYYTTGIYSILRSNLSNKIDVKSLNKNLNFVGQIGDRKFVRKAFGISKEQIIKTIIDDKKNRN